MLLLHLIVFYLSAVFVLSTPKISWHFHFPWLSEHNNIMTIDRTVPSTDIRSWYACSLARLLDHKLLTAIDQLKLSVELVEWVHNNNWLTNFRNIQFILDIGIILIISKPFVDFWKLLVQFLKIHPKLIKWCSVWAIIWHTSHTKFFQ